MTENDDNYVFISNVSELNYLINQIISGQLLAGEFKFTERDYFITLLKALHINYDEFTAKYFYFDSNRKLHISESELDMCGLALMG